MILTSPLNSTTGLSYRYAVAALAVAAIAATWIAVSNIDEQLLPFNIHKQARVGKFASVLSLILALSAHYQSQRSRKLATAAVVCAGIVLLASMIFVPM